MQHGNFSEEEVLKLARETYNKGNPSFKILSGNCALLVIKKNIEK